MFFPSKIILKSLNDNTTINLKYANLTVVNFILWGFCLYQIFRKEKTNFEIPVIFPLFTISKSILFKQKEKLAI